MHSKVYLFITTGRKVNVFIFYLFWGVTISIRLRNADIHHQLNITLSLIYYFICTIVHRIIIQENWTK